MAKEKLVMLSWNFIELKCGYTHYNENGKPFNPPMEIKNGPEGAYYDCPDEHCANRIPLIVYEKLLQELISLINAGKIEKGYVWQGKVSRQSYEYEILNYKPDIKATVGIKNLSIRKRV